MDVEEEHREEDNGGSEVGVVFVRGPNVRGQLAAIL